MTSAANLPDDAAAVRSLLGPANPVPDPALPPAEVQAARASVGLARAGTAPARPPRGRFVVAGALAAASVATLVALVAFPAGPGPETTSLATGPGAGAVRAAAAATEASETARGLLTVVGGGRTITASGTGSFGRGDAEGVIEDGHGATIRIVRTGAAVYARLPSGMTQLAGDKPWVSVDAATLDRLTSLAFGGGGGGGAADLTAAPLDALGYLRGVSGDVAVVGPDTIRGEPTTRYRATIDPSRAAAGLPAALPGHASAAAAAAPVLPTDLWIDGQGRLRKLVVTGDPGAGTAAGGGSATITLELWDFGIPVEVKAPPADQVADLSALLGTFAQNLRP